MSHASIIRHLANLLDRRNYVASLEPRPRWAAAHLDALEWALDDLAQRYPTAAVEAKQALVARDQAAKLRRGA